MTARLFKDVTASQAHATTALGNQGRKPKRRATMFADIGRAKQLNDGTNVEIATKFAQVLKVDEGHGLVLGWAIICKKDGADYFDLQDDNIPEDSMLGAAVDFMQTGAMAKDMHTGAGKGTVLFAWPMTTDIAKAFGIETKTTGLMIAMKPDSAEMLGKFRDGTYTGFSLGGWRIKDEKVA